MVSSDSLQGIESDAELELPVRSQRASRVPTPRFPEPASGIRVEPARREVDRPSDRRERVQRNEYIQVLDAGRGRRELQFEEEYDRGGARRGRVHELRGRPVEKLPKYSEELPFRHYLRQFEMIADEYGYSSHDRKIALLNRLRGKAVEYANEISYQDATYAEFVGYLLPRLSPEPNEQACLAKLQTRRQNRAESYADLSADLRRLVEGAYPFESAETHERMAINSFIKAISNTTVQFELSKDRPVSLLRAVSRAERLLSCIPGKVLMESSVKKTEASEDTPPSKPKTQEQPASKKKKKKKSKNARRTSGGSSSSSGSDSKPGLEKTLADLVVRIDKMMQFVEQMRQSSPPRRDVPRQLPQGCFLCGDTTHAARFCPRNDRRNLPPRNFWYQQRGNRLFQSREFVSQSRPVVRCFACQGIGHFANACPSNPRRSSMMQVGSRGAFQQTDVREEKRTQPSGNRPASR